MKTYYLKFGTSGDSRTYYGLAPTFLIFRSAGGTAVTAPSIAEVGLSSGIYYFQWGTTTPIAFLADAATTSPGADARYVVGNLDPVDRVDEQVVGIGSTASSFGSTTTDPVDLFGYLKRVQENLEGNNTFVKSTGVLSVYSRGSSTLLATKTIANSASIVTKT